MIYALQILLVIGSIPYLAIINNAENKGVGMAILAATWLFWISVYYIIWPH